ncbi:hypothetical protein PIB30_015047 [Stylosanthes scabra]|uniref:Membrane-associated kinase regulator 1 n=1 Tax=Stylosanthes scabra TaxID=79078 RepID=A0ABU6Z5E2_9FABA|nr:hypothetical protein [Stylosanthes scabra]
MGRRTRKGRPDPFTDTLPPSPSHSFSSSSSSSSDFEFTISISPRKSSTLLCPADELFYKGQLLPLHLSPRISMVRTLLLSSSSSAPRHSTASTTSTSSSSSSSSFTNDCDSSRPSSATDDENTFVNRHNNNAAFHCNKKPTTTTKYFSFSRFSSVFRKNRVETDETSVKKTGSSAKEVIRKYLNKVMKKPLSSFSHKSSKKEAKKRSATKETQTQTQNLSFSSFSCFKKETTGIINGTALVSSSHYFSGNLNYPRRRSTYVTSCPSSPTHSAGGFSYADTSTMEELQNAIQGAITHCKNSLVAQNKDCGQ